MPKTVFSYPGSKTMMSGWIIDHFPDHELYVEPFGGSAAVLVNKDPSYNEIFNDRDGDIVHFFRVLRDRTDELVEWLQCTPFSRELHLKYTNEFYDGYRPDDEIERAGRFFYLRKTQFAQKYTDVSGFRMSSAKNHAAEYSRAIDKLHEFRDRLKAVQIENLDYEELVDRTDAESTLYYFDPPYVDVGDELYSHTDRFDHERFVDLLDQIDGKWVVSYTDLPEGLQSGYWVVEQERRGSMRAGQGDWEQTNTERLVMNFDPEQTPRFESAAQTTLTAHGTQ